MIGRAFRRMHANITKRFVRPITFIHTPKCAGTFVQQAYGLHEKPWIRTIGHGCVRDIAPTGRHHAFVGLIREPVDWYASYVAFCRKSLNLQPQSVDNFPDTHPISVFSDNGRRSLTATIQSMADRSLLERLCTDGVVANVYARDIPDVYEFMLRTGSSFWTWTMMYHFSALCTSSLRTAADVRDQAKLISRRISFIRQHRLYEDMQSVLRLAPPMDRRRINSSERTSVDSPCQKARDLVTMLDGGAYAVLDPPQKICRNKSTL